MAFMIINKDDVQQEGESGYITKSGIYDVTLKHVEVVNTTNGAVSVNYFFDKLMAYNNNILGTNGQPTFGYKILEALATVVGEDELSDPEPTTVTFKKGAKELNCIPELTNVPVKVWIQFGYRMYKGDIQEDTSVRRFYRQSDGASGSEMITNKDIGTHLEIDTAVATEVRYEDGLTAESVAAWKKKQQSDSATKGSAPIKVAGFPGAKKATGFPGAK